MNHPKIALGGSELLLLEGIRHILRGQFSVAGISSDFDSLLHALRLDPVDLVLIDANDERWEIAVVSRHLKAISPHLRILALMSESRQRETSARARHGDWTTISRSSSSVELVQAIQEIWNSPDPRPGMAESDPAAIESDPAGIAGIIEEEGTLTLRQTEILRMIGAGFATKRIAVELGISPRTVEFHKYRLMRLLDIGSTAGLIRFAVSAGISGDAASERSKQ
jgi:DNA-binding NarL/FixJ family response regulator